MNATTLYSLREGQKAYVQDITTAGSMKRRLMDLGVISGTPIQCLQKSPAGDPVAYLIRGAAIALRSEDSENIKVTLVP